MKSAKTVITILNVVGTVLSIGGSIIGTIAHNKSMKANVAEEVAKAITNANK